MAGGHESSMVSGPRNIVTRSAVNLVRDAQFYRGRTGPIRRTDWFFKAPTRIDIAGEGADNGVLPITIRSLIVTTNAQPGACLSRACDAFERRPSVPVQENSLAVALWAGALGMKLFHPAFNDLMEAAHPVAALWGEIRQPTYVTLDFRLAATGGA